MITENRLEGLAQRTRMDLEASSNDKDEHGG